MRNTGFMRGREKEKRERKKGEVRKKKREGMKKMKEKERGEFQRVVWETEEKEERTEDGNHVASERE